MTVADRGVWTLRWRGTYIGRYYGAQAAVRQSVKLCAVEGLRWPMRGAAS